jgi:hypothetical protein
MALVPFRDQAAALAVGSVALPATLHAVSRIIRTLRRLPREPDWELLARANEDQEFRAGSQHSAGGPQGGAAMGRARRSRGGPRSNGGRGMAPTNRSDLSVKPPTYRVPSAVPKQVTNQVVWDVVKINTVISTSASSISETNFYWSLNNHPQASSWTTLFDQWCIPQYSATFQSAYPEGATTSPGILYTALDFDSANNLGSVQLLEDYSTCAAATLVSGQSVTRSVRPTVKGYLSSTSASGINRQWIDTATPSIPWYAIRSIVGVCGSSYPISVVTTIWFAFRNQI